MSRQLSLWISIPGAENILTDTLTMVILPHISLLLRFFLGVPFRHTHAGARARVHTHMHTQRRSHHESAQCQTIPQSQWLQLHTHSLLMPLACVHCEPAFCHNPSENKAEGEHWSKPACHWGRRKDVQGTLYWRLKALVRKWHTSLPLTTHWPDLVTQSCPTTGGPGNARRATGPGAPKEEM